MDKIPTADLRGQLIELDKFARDCCDRFADRFAVYVPAKEAAFAAGLDRPLSVGVEGAEPLPWAGAVEDFAAWCENDGDALRSAAVARIPDYEAALPGPLSQFCARRAVALWLWRCWATERGAGDLVPTPVEAAGVWRRKAAC